MPLRVEIAGTDRASVSRHGSITLSRQLGGAGTASVECLSTGGWRPTILDAVDIWEPCSTYNDAAISSGALDTLMSTAAGWTTGSVGQHVRIATGTSGYALRAAITAYVTSSSVTISRAATSAVTAQGLLVGTARFLGQISNVSEQRTRPDHLAYKVTASDLSKACELILPNATYTSGTHNVKERVNALVWDTDIWKHGVTDYWVDADEGADLTAGTYEYTQTLKSILDAILEEDAADRNWHTDALGRLWVSLSTSRPSGITLSTANENVRVVSPPTVSKQAKTYANRVIVDYQSPSNPPVVTCSTAEIEALGGRVCEFYENADALGLDLTEATARAAWWLDQYATRTAYTAILETTEALLAGETATVTLPLHGLSGTHLVQAAESRYDPTASRWLQALTATNASLKQWTWQDYWRSLR